MNIRITGARASAISAQLDNFYRQANPAVEVETPANVRAKYDLKSEGQSHTPEDKMIRKGTALVNGTMFDLVNDTSEFYARKSVFG